MILLILGLILWAAAHFLKRLAPEQRLSLQDRFGDASKGVIAAVLLFSIVLMVIGYRGAEGAVFWGRNPALTGINNLLMLLAIALLGLGSSKSQFRGHMRHPMLAGIGVWAIAHLVVNGDTASFVLFGGLAIWAMAEMFVINRAVPEYAPYEGGSREGDIRLIVITLVVYVVISVIHIWLGYNPFGG